MKKSLPSNRLINFRNINNTSDSYYLILSEKCKTTYLTSVLASIFADSHKNVEIQFLDSNNKVVTAEEVLIKGSLYYVLIIDSFSPLGYEDDPDYILQNNFITVLTENEYLKSSNEANIVSLGERIKAYEKAEMENFKKMDDKNKEFLAKSLDFQNKADLQVKDYMMKLKQMKEITEELRLISDQMEKARKNVEKKCNILL